MQIFVDRRRRCRGADRRRYPRLRFELFGCYTSTATGIFFEAGNVSLRGMYLPCRVPDIVGTRGTLRLRLPGRDIMLNMPVEVVWANGDDGGGMGLRFDGPDARNLKLLGGYLVGHAGPEAVAGFTTSSIARPERSNRAMSAPSTNGRGHPLAAEHGPLQRRQLGPEFS